MRLYRGLKEPYRPDRSPTAICHPRQGTDFTDCPYTALAYATGRRGVVLVLDVPDDVEASRVSEELWLGPKARRLMVWGKFDQHLVGLLPAKELRAEVRRKGMSTLPDEDKGRILKRAIAQRLAVDGGKIAP